ncbi:hypothetical protein L914_08785 [Phytophthora nicotianae]|uniref:Uncharacterized protein n=2 Tax=Phytophthora nicotianae TaxID=4792 RepID=W2NCQ2_PHYNI|nr:hypothetical protein L914_08785 [Phytophthora nicotianae]ETO75239.1 hypothetical protein F444_09149 [Phytophthora nicotianae P1976]
MLSIPAATTSSTSGSRLHYRPIRGDAWRRKSPSLLTTSLDLKRQQLIKDKYQQFESRTSMSNETEQADEALEEPPSPPKRRILTAFRCMTFTESEDGEESEYVPSEDEENETSEEHSSAEELLDSHQEEKQETSESEEEGDPDDDSRWWESSEDKYKWEKHYKQADAAFRKRFGCGIDTPTHPETRRKLKKKKPRYQAYKYLLAGLVIVNLVQLALVYSASSWAFSMVTWRPWTADDNVGSGEDHRLVDTPSSEHVVDVLAPFTQQQVPEHVRTGLYLCSSLSRRVVKSEHDVTATQHALRACDIAVKFAPLESREAIEAHVLRGDLRSLLSLFDGADEDYNSAKDLMLESNMDLKLARVLTQDLELKLIANRWTQLYKTKSFKELRREAKARVTQLNNSADAVSALAADWLSAFKRKKPVLDVLTAQRGWTLRRLKYEAWDNDERIPDKR